MGFNYFSSLLYCPLCFQGSPQTQQWECFLVFGNFSLFKTPFLGRSSIPTSFISFLVCYIFSYLLSKTMGCFSGCLMSSASIQKLFCGIYSAFKCSFDEFVGEKEVFPSYSSAILGPPPSSFTFIRRIFSSSSLSAIRVVSSAYLRLLLFLLAILILAWASSSLAFHMMYSAYKLNKQGGNIQPWHTPFWILLFHVWSCHFLTCIQVSQEAGKVF